jgi:hypothetical protein
MVTSFFVIGVGASTALYDFRIPEQIQEVNRVIRFYYTRTLAKEKAKSTAKYG